MMRSFMNYPRPVVMRSFAGGKKKTEDERFQIVDQINAQLGASSVSFLTNRPR